MKIVFDTVRRSRAVREGGEVVLLDWDEKAVLRRRPVFPEDPEIPDDPNPRGNSRGGKGIAVAGAEILVGTYHAILVLDRGLRTVGRIVHPLFAGLHEIALTGEGVWAAATAIDAAVLVDRAGRLVRSWWPREEPLLRDRHGLVPAEIDKAADHRVRHVAAEASLSPGHVHLNAVACGAGRTVALLNGPGLLVQLEPRVEVLAEDPLLRGAHSPRILEDPGRVVVGSSFARDVLVYELEGGRRTRRVHLPGFEEVARILRERPDRPFSRSVFVRGLEPVGPDRVLVGISPAAILEVDLERGRLLDLFRYSDDVSDAIHGLARLPEDAPGPGSAA